MVAIPEVSAVMRGVVGRAGVGGFVLEIADGTTVGVVRFVTVPAADGDVGAAVAIEDIGVGGTGTWVVAALRSSEVDATGAWMVAVWLNAIPKRKKKNIMVKLLFFP